MVNNVPQKQPEFKVELNLKSTEELYYSYMPFLKYGGLFVPTEAALKMGEEILVMLKLPGQADTKTVVTKVAWISFIRVSIHRPKGVGLAFVENEYNLNVKQLIESLLGSELESSKATFTL